MTAIQRFVLRELTTPNLAHYDAFSTTLVISVYDGAENYTNTPVETHTDNI